MGRLSVSLEKLADVLDDAKALSSEHWNALPDSPWKRANTFNPDWDMLVQQNAQGFLQLLVLRSSSGLYIGHAAYYIHTSPLTRRLTADHSVFCLKKEWTKGKAALILLKAIDTHCQELGVAEIFSTHPKVPVMERLLHFQGYTAVGTVYYKTGG